MSLSPKEAALLPLEVRAKLCDFVCAKLISFYRQPESKEKTYHLIVNMISGDQTYELWNNTSVGNISAIMYHLGREDEKIRELTTSIWDGYIKYLRNT